MYCQTGGMDVGSGIYSDAFRQLKRNIVPFFVSILLVSILAGAMNSIPLAGFVAYFFVACALNLGLTGMFLDAAYEKKVQGSDIFKHFDRIMPVTGLCFLQSLYIMLWSMLFVIPGIVKWFSYSMSMFIMRDNPGLPADDCIKESMALMEGNKAKLFKVLIVPMFIVWVVAFLVVGGFSVLCFIPFIASAGAASTGTSGDEQISMGSALASSMITFYIMFLVFYAVYFMFLMFFSMYIRLLMANFYREITLPYRQQQSNGTGYGQEPQNDRGVMPQNGSGAVHQNAPGAAPQDDSAADLRNATGTDDHMGSMGGSDGIY